MDPTIFTSVINSYLPDPQAALLNGIIFGIPLRSSKVFYQQLQVVGLLHLVVLSGMNITILGSIIAIMTRNLPKKISLLISLLGIAAFTLFVGPQPPIVRAAIMGSLGLIATLYGRKKTAFISLLVSVVCIAIIKPDWLTTISMQLSVGATLGIILFGTGGANDSSIVKDLRTSLSAQIFTAPLIFIYFKQVSLISPIANLLVSSLVAPLMIFGFVTSILGKVYWLLGLPTAYICYGLLTYMIWVINILAKVPGAFFQFK
ncbi:ComEC/Rec2 family competence protein [Candidatus Roizmanbacteria bacterium]|nr:ComEC/Rec2 family competence protein [Candidatus Roizmanbacteria bacterium]